MLEVSQQQDCQRKWWFRQQAEAMSNTELLQLILIEQPLTKEKQIKETAIATLISRK